MTISHLGRIDYADKYSVLLPEPMDAPRFCSLILESAPRWLDLALSMRDRVTGPFGFSTQERNYGRPVHLEVGRKFGPLVVQSVSPDLVVCGNADAHLVFRSLFQVDAARQCGSFTTEVQFSDRIGRAYFALVKPFHKRIIPALASAPFRSRARAESPESER
ncbi:DUF2867 domain-containing protein [Streptomyces sp. NBC_00536]|uniref:DUF2867 domain-containing protein n=1 Tax=Streptomyces sp. NBC_00536 TaxID=2975769 RepID=UPI002E80F0C8|nr:DUF2867 domain-containing protein [Streptomyces sp. NBC_00536]WUC83161.1 DUF2867 domain-containing protein [Streptomyces sp. NBC_00536]